MSKRNGPHPRPAIERLLARIEIDPGTECWLWTGSTGANGYGQIGVGSVLDGTRGLATTHRVAYEAMVGVIPDGMVLDHLCRVRLCANPDHLEPVTFVENVKRGEAGRHGFNSRKTHCPAGHPYDEANTHISRAGKRQCRACSRARYHARKGAS